MRIRSSVGNRGANDRADVIVVQRLLNRHLASLSPLLSLIDDGDCGPVTTGMIIEFQKRVVGLKRPDGTVEPAGKTMEALVDEKPRNVDKTQPLYDPLLLTVQAFLRATDDWSERKFKNATISRSLVETDYVKAATLLGVDVATIKAVAHVESAGDGFLPNGLPKILFEGHWFSKFSKGQFDTKHPTLSYKKWTKSHYKGGTAEYARYNAAKALDADAAMNSTSWGKFQIMGFNYAKSGYSDLNTFVRDMYKNEGAQLNAFVGFLKTTKLDAHLKAKNWSGFAKGYNGPAYAENRYDIRMRQAHNAFSARAKAS